MLHLAVALAVFVGFIWALVVFPSFRIVAVILIALAVGSWFVLNENATRENKKYEAAKAQEEQQRQVKFEADQKEYCQAQQERKLIEEKRWKIVPASQIELRDASLAQAQQSYGASSDDYRFTASARNKSKFKVVGLRMNVTALDCPTQDVRAAACEIVGRDENAFGADVPAGEVRRVEGKFALRNLPKARGVIMPKFVVSAVRAALDQSDDPSERDDVIGRYLYKCN